MGKAQAGMEAVEISGPESNEIPNPDSIRRRRERIPARTGSTAGQVSCLAALAFAWLVSATEGAAVKPDRAALAADLTTFFAGVEKCDAALPRAEFELDALANSLSRDPKKICDWVAGQTRWIPYAGVLHGAEGVLLERRGNSLDRAMLLAALLESAGHPGQLVHATLPDASAQKVIELSLVPLPPTPSLDRSRAVARETMAALKTVPPASEAKSDPAAEHLGVKGVREQASRIVASLQHSGLNLPTTAPDLLPDARDHWWVRIEDGASVDLDPDARDLKAGHFDVEPDTVTAPADLAEDLRQSVTVKIVVERWSAGALSETEALSTKFLLGREVMPALTLDHNSPEWKDVTPPTSAEKILGLMAQTKRWQPILRTPSGAIAGKLFDETGWVSEAIDASPAGVGAAAGGLLGGFGGGDAPAVKTDGVLTAEWLDFYFNAPGRPERMVRREIIDLLGPARRALVSGDKPVIAVARVAEARTRLSGAIEMELINCRPSSVYFDHRLLARMLSVRESWLALVTADRPADGAGLLLAAEARPDALFNFALVRRLVGDTGTFETGPLVVLNFDAPMLLPAGKIGLRRLIDVADNPTVSSTGDFGAVVRQGVGDTAAEFYALTGRAEGSRNLFAQLAVFPVPAGLDPVLSGTTGDLKGQSPGADARARIDAALAGGYGLILSPDRAHVEDPWRFGWWRIDPKSGACIGVLASGYNSDLTEESIMQERQDILLRAIRVAARNGDREALHDIASSLYDANIRRQILAADRFSLEFMQYFSALADFFSYI